MDRYEAVVEIDREVGPGGEGLDLDLVGEALAGHWPTAGVSEAGRWALQVSVTAVSSPLAAALAHGLVRAATGAQVVEVVLCPGREEIQARRPVPAAPAQ